MHCNNSNKDWLEKNDERKQKNPMQTLDLNENIQTNKMKQYSLAYTYSEKYKLYCTATQYHNTIKALSNIFEKFLVLMSNNFHHL